MIILNLPNFDIFRAYNRFQGHKILFYSGEKYLHYGKNQGTFLKGTGY